MECTHSKNQNGFTLVEISIVMIIIGLLIGGTFGGMKLVENMQVNKTVQDLKAIESAALTFKDTYGRLPGDMPNTAARLPNCTVAPCATGGNGDRRLNINADWIEALTDTNERFTFWHHLQAADLLAMDYRNTTDMEFGEGQPSMPVGGGYRLTGFFNGLFWATSQKGHMVFLGGESDGEYYANSWYTSGPPCSAIRSIDNKMDDARPTTGRLVNPFCVTGSYLTTTADWSGSTSNSGAAYFLSF